MAQLLDSAARAIAANEPPLPGSVPKILSGHAESVKRTSGCGDASACLKLRTPFDPTRPANRHFKSRARGDTRKVQENVAGGSCTSLDGDEAMDGFLDGREGRRWNPPLYR